MTERFVPPEGAVDVPALCRQEVGAFFAWWLDPKNFGGINDPRTVEDYFAEYCAARFPEAAPEMCPEGGTCDGHPCAGCGRKRPVGARSEAAPESCEHEWEPTRLGRTSLPVTPPEHREKGEFRTCRKCQATKLFLPTPTAPAETVRTCGHVQAGECANCLAEQLKRQSDSLRRKDGVVAAPPSEAPAKEAIERALASLGKAYPYLVKHADHIDGEFSNALAEVRRMLGVAAAKVCGAQFEKQFCTFPERHGGDHSWQNRPLPLPERDERTCPTCGALPLYSERIGVSRHRLHRQCL